MRYHMMRFFEEDDFDDNDAGAAMGRRLDSRDGFAEEERTDVKRGGSRKDEDADNPIFTLVL